MISVCILTRDDPYIFNLFDRLEQVMPCEYELCIGDNGTKKSISEKLEQRVDEYIKISDKQLFRMGIPWGHNIINSIANTYKIFYIDTDEYPVWIHPNIEEMFDTSYVIPALRLDFIPFDKVNHLYEILKGRDFNQILDYFKPELENKSLECTAQDRTYNSRYAQFNGVCHAIFHCPQHFRSKEAGSILLHNRTVREGKNKMRMDHLIDEQFARQNINPFMGSSDICLKWGKGMKHRYADWIEFTKAFK